MLAPSETSASESLVARLGKRRKSSGGAEHHTNAPRQGRVMETILTSPIAKSFLAGSISGTCSTLLFQPLDLLKTRIQTPLMAGTKPDGMIAICRNVLYQEKVWGLWKGTSPSVVRCVPGVGLYFCSLHTIQSRLGSANPGNVELLLTGVAARCLVGVTMLPVTVVKVRFESGLFQYGGVVGAMRTIYNKEGTRGLYSGLLATLVRDAPFSGLYLLFYTNSKRMIPLDRVQPSHLPLIHFSCGIVAGTLASVVTQPADVIKTHMQMTPDKFTSITAVVRHVYQTNGPTGFMAGIVPRTLKRTMMAALAWTVFEQVMKKLGLK